MANGGDGIIVMCGTSDDTIGGTASGAGNVVAGNVDNAISLHDTSYGPAQGNDIGSDHTGDVALPNHGCGATINNGSTHNSVGGTTAAARNVIGANDGDGADIVNSGPVPSAPIGYVAVPRESYYED